MFILKKSSYLKHNEFTNTFICVLMMFLYHTLLWQSFLPRQSLDCLISTICKNVQKNYYIFVIIFYKIPVYTTQKSPTFIQVLCNYGIYGRNKLRKNSIWGSGIFSKFSKTNRIEKELHFSIRLYFFIFGTSELGHLWTHLNLYGTKHGATLSKKNFFIKKN